MNASHEELKRLNLLRKIRKSLYRVATLAVIAAFTLAGSVDDGHILPDVLLTEALIDTGVMMAAVFFADVCDRNEQDLLVKIETRKKIEAESNKEVDKCFVK